jgi:hypothetical protein
MTLLTAIPAPGGRYARARTACLAGCTLVALAGFGLVATLRNGDYAVGFEQTTLTRAQGGTPPLTVFRHALVWTWPLLLAGACAAVMACAPGSAAARFPRRPDRLLICAPAGRIPRGWWPRSGRC